MAVSSMTGYAVASAPTGLGTVTVECRSVNSRFLDLTLRLAEDLRFAEPLIREILQKSLARGKVEIRASLTPDENAAPATINRALLARLAEMQRTVREVVPSARELSVSDLLHTPGVVISNAPDQDELEKKFVRFLRSSLTPLKPRVNAKVVRWQIFCSQTATRSKSM